MKTSLSIEHKYQSTAGVVGLQLCRVAPSSNVSGDYFLNSHGEAKEWWGGVITSATSPLYTFVPKPSLSELVDEALAKLSELGIQSSAQALLTYDGEPLKFTAEAPDIFDAGTHATLTWYGQRVPKKILHLTTRYFRDGGFTTAEGFSGTYNRLIDSIGRKNELNQIQVVVNGIHTGL